MNKIKKLSLMLILVIFSFLTLGNAANQSIIVNFKELPETKSTINQNLRIYDKELSYGIGKVVFKKKGSSKLYRMELEYEGKKYIKNSVTLPDATGKDNEILGYYWTEKSLDKVSQYIMFFQDLQDKNFEWLEKNKKQYNLAPFQISTLWNLTTKEYTTNKKLVVYGIIKEKAGHYFLDVVLPLPTEQLISISVNYKYFRNYIFGITGNEYDANYTIINTDIYDDNLHLPTWSRVLLSEFKKEIIQQLQNSARGEEIKRKKIELQEYTLAEKRHFVSTFNRQIKEEILYREKNNIDKSNLKSVTLEEIFNAGNDNKVYKVHLQQLDEWFQKGITFKEVQILDVAYLYKGKVYQAGYHTIDSNVPDKIYQDNFFDKVGKFIKEIIDALKEAIKKNPLAFFGIIAAIFILGVIAYLFGPGIRGFSKFVGRKLNDKKNKSKVQTTKVKPKKNKGQRFENFKKRFKEIGKKRKKK